MICEGQKRKAAELENPDDIDGLILEVDAESKPRKIARKRKKIISHHQVEVKTCLIFSYHYRNIWWFECDVDEIIGERFNESLNRKEWLVMWVGFAKKDATWEPVESLKNNEAFMKYQEANDGVIFHFFHV